MAKTVSVIQKQRANTAANWAMANPVLILGVIGVVSDATPLRFKIGDGSTTWNSLPFIGEMSMDTDLVAIAALTGTSGLLKKTAANTWALDTSLYFVVSVGTATSLTSISIAFTRMVITISSAQGTFTYAATPPEGFEQTILLKNSSGTAITQAIPNSGTWKSLDGASITVPASGSVELNILYIDGIYRVAAKA